jgi:RHS repeat-associated protein
VADYPAEEFRLDGDPTAIRSSAARWSTFGTEASDAATQIRALDTTLFVGPEGEQYRQGLKESLPPHLDVTGTAYQSVGGALTTFASALSGLQDRMRPIAAKAPALWQALQTAQGRVSAAHTADQRHQQALRDAPPPPAGQSPAPDTYHSDTSTATGTLTTAQQAWNDNLTAARAVQTDLHTAIDTCCTAIHAAADTRFKHNPHGLGAVTAAFKNFVSDHVAELAKLSSVLKLVSGIAGVLSFIPVIGEVAAPIALITAGAALAIDASIKYATGKGSWTSIAIDGALLALPFGMGKAAEALRGARGAEGLAPALVSGERSLAGEENAVRTLAEDGAAARTGVREVDETGRPLTSRACEKDPVDVATGQVLLGQVDVELPGVLPLLLTRTHISSYRVGRWFGPSWASTLDQRVELDAEGACYTSADGMVLAYPPLPAGPHPVLPLAGPRLPLATRGDGCEITDEATGQRLHFARVPGRPRTVLPLVAITDRNGNRVEVGYDAAGAPATVRHTGGYTVRVETAAGRIAALHLVDGDGETELIRYGYDGGQLTEVVNSSGLPLRFDYDRAGRLRGWTDRNGTGYRYDYDQSGRCVHTEGSDGTLTADFHYRAEPRVTTVVEPTGHRTTYHLNATGRVVAVTDPLGNSTISEWDDADRLAASTDPLGRTTRWQRDGAGNVTALVRPDGSRLIASYNALRLPVTITGADGATWRRTYDERGNLTAVTDPSGATTHYSYDEAGGPVTMTDALGRTRRLANNPAGLPLAVTDPSGATRTYRYDAFGRVVAETDPLDNSTRYAYSTEGQLTSRTLPDGASEHWRYDGEGNLVEHRDAAGASTHIETGRFDLPAARIGPDGARLEFSHDAELRLTSVTNPQGLVWRYDYDPAGRLVRETDFNGRVLEYAYDPAGQLVERRAGTATLRFSYDLVGNLTERRSTEAVTTFGYDAAGRLTHARNADADVTYERDALGRVLTETCDGRTVRSSYDAIGRRISRSTPSGAVSEWDYTDVANPVALRVGAHTVEFEYDAAGREVLRQLDGTTAVAQSWDTGSRLLSQTILTGPSAPIQHRGYRYRRDGRLIGIEDRALGNRTFDLDTAGRVTAVRAANWTEHYAYDPAGNVTAASWPTTDPQESAAGNRQYTGTLIRRAGAIRYEHDNQGRVTLRQQRRLSKRPANWRYTWNAENRLTAVTTPDGQHWRYRYDPFGRRTAKQRIAPDGSVADETTFAWDGPVLAEQTNDSEATTWDWQPGTFRPVTQRERTPSQTDIDERFYAIVTDLVGTPTELLTADGTIAWRAHTALWGPTTTGSGPVNCPLRFPGQYHDPESQLNYNLHRHYDPATARYHSPDPLGLAGSPNPHTYVPNPTTWTDPLGLTPGCSSTLYRSMSSEGEVPKVAASARGLGARPGTDIPLDSGGIVHPNTGGMSVSPHSPHNLPEFRRPPEFNGTGKDPVWSMESNDLPDGLQYRPDPAKPATHGFIEPAHPMAVDQYQSLIAQTQGQWTLVAP